MGTHPIFESDFDCLTDKMNITPVFVGITSGAVFLGLSLQLNNIKNALESKLNNFDQHLRALAAQQASQQAGYENIRALHDENEDPDRNIA